LERAGAGQLQRLARRLTTAALLALHWKTARLPRGKPTFDVKDPLEPGFLQSVFAEACPDSDHTVERDPVLRLELTDVIDDSVVGNVDGSRDMARTELL
jgi:hypothetical protein